MESLRVLLEVGISLHIVLLKNEEYELDLFCKKFNLRVHGVAVR